MTELYQIWTGHRMIIPMFWRRALQMDSLTYLQQST